MSFYNSFETDDEKLKHNLFQLWQQNLLQQWKENICQTNLFDLNSSIEMICLLLYNIVITAVKTDNSQKLTNRNLANFIRVKLESYYDEYEKIGWKFLLNVKLNSNEIVSDEQFENVPSKASSKSSICQCPDNVKFNNKLNVLVDLIRNE